MTAIEKFKLDLQNWLVKNGFDKLEFKWDEDFGYETDTHVMRLGVQAFPEIASWFEEFLIENGCHYSDIVDPVKCFLHELGHHMTNYKFTSDDLFLCYWLKRWEEGTEEMTDKEFMFHYWNIADEFAANTWAILFINNHIDAVCELIDIYAEDWNLICDDYDVFELVGQTL